MKEKLFALLWRVLWEVWATGVALVLLIGLMAGTMLVMVTTVVTMSFLLDPPAWLLLLGAPVGGGLWLCLMLDLLGLPKKRGVS